MQGLVLHLSYAETDWEQNLKDLRRSGELRKACTKAGNAIQPPSRVKTMERLKKLRKLMVNETITRGVRLDAYLIPAQDEHQNEFVAEYDARREYISGFSGSYGDALVTANKSVLWTDGRYHLQADDQLDCNWLLMRENYPSIPTIPEWLAQEFPNGGLIGVDPKLIAQSTWEQLNYDLVPSNFTLVEIDRNLVDILWVTNRPPKRNKDVFILADVYSGENWTKKIEKIRQEMRKIRADAMVVTALDEIAWLLNLRGRDIPYSPFVRSYLLLDMSKIRIYVNQTQLLKNNISAYFEKTRQHPRNTMEYDSVQVLVYNLTTRAQIYARVLVPSKCVGSLGASRKIALCLPAKKRVLRPSPIVFLKAQKNPVEIRGMYNAHIRDAAAVCEFFAYLENRFKSGAIFTELHLVKILNEFRFEQRHSLGNSFRTIAAFGSNGALPHYEPTPNTNIDVVGNSTLVLDSGGQYLDGTTDVTRTVHLGDPTDEQKDAYTRVLIGQIQLSLLTFPENLLTSVADALARAPLWDIGMDYLHGTSHGVGSFSSVHESPVFMYFDDPPLNPRTQRLKPGYFLSNEPGYYRAGDFGIRLENVMEVIEKRWLGRLTGHGFLGFKTVTLVPYEPKLIDLKLLSPQHRRWLNSYNEQIRRDVGAELKRQSFTDGFYWMMDKTENIPEHGAASRARYTILYVTVLVFMFL